MNVEKLYLFPVLFAALVPVTLLITYIIAVSDDDVYPFFPYVSDTGTLPPESCVFGQFLNIAALLILITVCVRYKQLDTFWSSQDAATKFPKTNNVALVMGVLAALGLSIVANFQVDHVKSVHIIGAFFAFIVGGMYFYIQAYISWSARDIPGSSKIVRVAQLIICVLYAVFAIIGIVTVIVGKSKLGPSTILTREWSPEYAGYAEHVVSTVMEWLGTFLICAFALTFVPEFKQLNLELTFKIKNVDSNLMPSA